MPIFRSAGVNNGLLSNNGISPGDVLALGESFTAGSITTVGSGTWVGAAFATGMIRRTGPAGGFTDTTDSSTNILLALGGNAPGGADVIPGTSFRLLFVNTVAFAHTFAAGLGIVSGLGILSCAASAWREYNVIVLNSSAQQVLQCTTTNASAVVTFVFPPGQVAYPVGNAFNAINITPGMTVSGTNITAGTTVLGLTQGLGGIIGVTLSAAATGSGATALTFLPTIQMDSLRSGTL